MKEKSEFSGKVSGNKVKMSLPTISNTNYKCLPKSNYFCKRLWTMPQESQGI